jgi:hypothetical protein
MVALQFAAAAVSVIGCAVLVLYVTWRFLRRVRGGEHVAPSFREWIRGMFEAVWGL